MASRAAAELSDADDGGSASAESERGLASQLAAARPEADPLTREVWRARIAGALFGVERPIAVGRYRIERHLGRGGGGSVFVARDPELHRDVAVKLIRCASERHRRSALTEARALARISHPHVVAVHDVGEHGDYIYVVMELLRGASLRELAAAPRTPLREIVAAYRQAAHGLAAAHAAGLVHRDFKPDNAVLGADRRLRVVDFGLAVGLAAEAGAPGDGPGGASERAPASAGAGAAGARAAPPVPGAIAGTPRYMAPEQRAGGPLGPAIDQYALGTALREAGAAGGRAIPAWLDRVISRATAARPADRFPSMADLARALGRDPRTVWARRAAVAAPALLAAVGFGIGRSGTAAPVCSGGAEALAPVWTSERAAGAARRVAELGTPFAQAAAASTRARLEGLGATWLSAHRRSCEAHGRGELTAEHYQGATVCLARVRAGIGAALDLLERAPATALDRALGALGATGDAAACADPLALAADSGALVTPAQQAVDQEIEAAAVHARGATSEAIGRARRAGAVAAGLGEDRLLARALLVEGHALIGSGALGAAVAPLRRARDLAIRTGQDALAVEAYARHAYARAYSAGGDPAAVLGGLDLIELLGARAGESGTFARALLANNVGALAALGGDFTGAAQRYREAVAAAAAVRGPGAVELATALSNLAMLSPDPDERMRLFELAWHSVVRGVGADHPDALWRQLAVITERRDASRVVAELRAACPRVARLHPTHTQLVEVCAFELAWQATAVGDREAVAAAAGLAAAAPAGAGEPAPPSTLAQLTAHYGARVGALQPDRAQAALPALEALAAAERAQVPRRGWYQLVFAADAALGLAAAARAAGEPARAAAAAAAAAAHLERLRAITGAAGGLVSRRLAYARELGAAGGAAGAARDRAAGGATPR
jgi:hypothetical protein